MYIGLHQFNLEEIRQPNCKKLSILKWTIKIKTKRL